MQEEYTFKTALMMMLDICRVTFTVASEVVVVNNFNRDELPMQFCSVAQYVMERIILLPCLRGLRNCCVVASVVLPA